MRVLGLQVGDGEQVDLSAAFNAQRDTAHTTPPATEIDACVGNADLVVAVLDRARERRRRKKLERGAARR